MLGNNANQEKEIYGVILEDGTYINSNYDLKEHLTSLGYDPYEVGVSLLGEHVLATDGGEWVRRDEIDDYEMMYAELDVNLRNFVNDVKELNEVFVNSRKYTKAKYVQMINAMFHEYFSI